jgi:hypothetical protein
VAIAGTAFFAIYQKQAINHAYVAIWLTTILYKIELRMLLFGFSGIVAALV